MATPLSQSELASLGGQLLLGRNPLWVEQDLITQVPYGANEGVDLNQGSDGGSVVTPFQVRVRRVAAFRTAVFQITEVDSETYTVGFVIEKGGSVIQASFPSGVSATKQEIADGLKAAIEAVPTLDAAFSVYSEQDPTTGDYRVRVHGKRATGGLYDFDYGIEPSSATNAADLVVTADPTYCRFIIWTMDGGQRANESEPSDVNENQPYTAPGVDPVADPGTEETNAWLNPTQVEAGVMPIFSGLQGEIYVPYSSLGDRFTTAGKKRVAVQITEIRGSNLDTDRPNTAYFNPRVLIGPAVRESEKTSGT